MPEAAQQRQVVLRRADLPGDLGWIVMAHGELYDRQFGWNTEFEALVAGTENNNLTLVNKIAISIFVI